MNQELGALILLKLKVQGKYIQNNFFRFWFHNIISAISSDTGNENENDNHKSGNREGSSS